MSGYEDDRPGMMRIHIAQRRADALESTFTRDTLRLIAARAGVPTGYPTKRDLAIALAFAGVVAPAYDKAAER